MKIVFNLSLYPTKDDLREATEIYLQANYKEFYNKFTRSRWIVYFDGKIYQEVIITFLYLVLSLSMKLILNFFFLMLMKVINKATIVARCISREGQGDAICTFRINGVTPNK